MSAPTTPMEAMQWKYLAPNPKSKRNRLCVKGTRIRAETLYALTVDGSEPMTPEHVAEDYGLPLEVVKEAIAYCETNPAEMTTGALRPPVLPQVDRGAGEA